MSELNSKPFRENIKKYLFILLVTCIVLFFTFNANDYLTGPKITIISPAPYTVIKGDTFDVIGNVKNAKNIYINGREVSVGEKGDFGEVLISKEPYTLVIIRAVDRYGKITIKTFEVSADQSNQNTQ